MKNFKKLIKNVSPEHDTPAGLIHPYWARKPLNVIEAIINSYSKPGENVLDPFMGSGTTVIAALKNNRNIVGCDLNPISNLIVSSIIDGFTSVSSLQQCVMNAIINWVDYSLHLYQIDEKSCVEREFYLVTGSYVDGKFKIRLRDANVAYIVDNRLQGNRRTVQEIKYKNSYDSLLINNPVDFSIITFVENTRIAIHRGTKASDFFTKRNIVFINYAKKYIKKHAANENEKRILDLFLSSLIPMLRLSDKKASSQWPYWRPKKELTSRNPVVAINKRRKAFVDYFDWLDEVASECKTKAEVYHCSAQSIAKKTFKRFDLILTDPPYADHAPYIEYSALYWSIIGVGGVKDLWSEEIVKTNAVGRMVDSLDYTNRLKNSLIATLRLLKNNGYFVFFYLDKNINHWHYIKSALSESGCMIEDVIPIPKQRRSIKAVTTPGKTLDGDLIIICKKQVTLSTNLKKTTVKQILKEIKADTYFEKFGAFIKKYLMSDVLDIDEWNLKDISRIF